MTKIKEGSKTIDTFSLSLGKREVNRPHYMDMYLNEKNTNKFAKYGLLAITTASILLNFGQAVMNSKNIEKIESWKREVTRMATMYGKSESMYQDLLRHPIVKYEIPTETTSQIKMVFGEDADLMTKVAICESGLKHNAQNKTSSARGIFQVLSKLHNIDKKWLDIPLINALVAKSLFDASGVNPWVSSRGCWNK